MRPYLWLFVGAWAGLTGGAWVTGDWNAYYDRGFGTEVKFRLAMWEQFVISAFLGVIGAALVSALVAALVTAARCLSGFRRAAASSTAEPSSVADGGA